MNATNIEWTDVTWNPMTGCTKISSGCDHCYAQVVAERRTRAKYLAQAPVSSSAEAAADPFAPRFWAERLTQPAAARAPKRVFVNSMSDVFHAHFRFTEHIAPVFAAMGAASHHDFQLLTKRPERALRYADRLPWPAHVHLGVTVESRATRHRVDTLRQMPAAVRFLSIEPLLEDLGAIDLTGIHWVIAGFESGAGARPGDPQWLRALRDQCVDAGIAFFLKQLGGFPNPRGHALAVLDGRTWKEFPRPHPRVRAAA